VLQHFLAVPESIPAAQDQLADLRALARRVAGRIGDVPSVRNAYWVRDLIPPRDQFAKLDRSIQLQRCLAEWGGFWQEKPEDAVALYRHLLSSAVFSYIHMTLWSRELERPALAGWTEEDRRRGPAVWHSFLQELAGSSDPRWQIEGKLLEISDVIPPQEARQGFTAIDGIVDAHGQMFVTNTVDLLYLDAGSANLLGARLGDGRVSPEKEELSRWYYRQFRPRLEKLRQAHLDYWNEQRRTRSFERQVRFLSEQAPLDQAELREIFPTPLPVYTPEQARELHPLLQAYRSNLTAGASPNDPRSPGWATLQSVEHMLDRALPRTPTAQTTAPRSPRPTPPNSVRPPPGLFAGVLPAPLLPPPAPTNLAQTRIVLVDQFIAMPSHQLLGQIRDEFRILGQRWRDNRLWLDCDYWARSESGAQVANVGTAVAYDLESGRWSVYPYQDGDNPRQQLARNSRTDSNRDCLFEVWKGALYVSERDAVRKCELGTESWRRLEIPIPARGLARLFVVGERLYATTGESIVEVLGADQFRLLASCRRRPTVSSLDALESLGEVSLFSGPAQALRAALAGKVYDWDGADWHMRYELQYAAVVDCGDYTLLRRTPLNSHGLLWLLQAGAAPKLCWRQELRRPGMPSAFAQAGSPRQGQAEALPAWPQTTDLPLGHAAVTGAQSVLYFIAEHSGFTNRNGTLLLEEKDGRHADLIRIDPSAPTPVVIPLRFDLGSGPLTSTSLEFRRGKLAGAAQFWIQSTPRSFLIGQTGLAGFWVVPISTVTAAAADLPVGR
jgi:hypothetical protein